MKYTLIYENNKVVFSVVEQKDLLINTAKYFRTQTMGM